MKQFCELTKPVSKEQPSTQSYKLSNKNDIKTEEKSEQLRLSMTSCLPQNNKLLNIENMSTSSQHDLRIYKTIFNKKDVI